MGEERALAVRQYIVFRVKIIELLHLMLLSFQLSETRVCPVNVMGHGIDRFKETLLGSCVTTFMAMSDDPKSTNIRKIWKLLYPRHAKAIDRIWNAHITPGEKTMKFFRNKAGAHGDRPQKYFEGKIRLFTDKQQVLTALATFCGLSVCLLRRQDKEIPGLSSELEGVLLDIDLNFPEGKCFNRRWLREMHLVDSGSYSKKFI